MFALLCLREVHVQLDKKNVHPNSKLHAESTDIIMQKNYIV